MKPSVPPPIHHGGRKPVYPWASLKVGEFFFVPDRDRNNLASLAWHTGRNLGFKFETRLCYMARVGGKLGQWLLSDEDQRGAVLGIGVWRVA
jgi:hypothetical protein